jgi:hypothetical protein
LVTAWVESPVTARLLVPCWSAASQEEVSVPVWLVRRAMVEPAAV